MRSDGGDLAELSCVANEQDCQSLVWSRWSGKGILCHQITSQRERARVCHWDHWVRRGEDGEKMLALVVEVDI